MEEQRKIVKKNHWTQTKIDNATKKINQEIYERNRQAPLQLKLDDMAIYINDKITRRGIAKGLVSIQEDLNNSILKVEKQTMELEEKYFNFIKELTKKIPEWGLM